MWLPGKSFYYNYVDSSTSFEPYYVMLYKSDDMTALINMLYMQFQTASVSKLCIMSVFIKLQLQFHAILHIQLLFKHRITFINSNFHLQKERISSNIRVRVLINVVMMQCAPHFRYIDKNFFVNPVSSKQEILSSIQLQARKNFFHQSSFY